MIRTFRDKGTEMIFRRRWSKRLPQDIQGKAYDKLQLIDAADALDDLRKPPRNRLELLVGDRAGQYSIRINDRWRICFAWREDDAWDVEIVDYH